MKRDLIKGHLDLLLLAIVARGPAHGYAIVAALRDQSGGTFDLPEGTVYPALHRLERAGFLVSGWENGATRSRRVYELSGVGREALRDRGGEWRAFMSGIQAVLAAQRVPSGGAGM